MNIKTKILIGTLAAALLPGLPGSAWARTVNVSAKAYSAGSGKLLFTENHQWTYAGQKPVRVVATYRSAAGQSLGKRVTDFTKDGRAPGAAPDEVFTKPSGYLERIQNRGGSFALSYREKTGAPVKSGTVARSGITAGGQGLDNLILARWSELNSGSRVAFKFLVPARQTAYSFSMRSLGRKTVRGRPALLIRVELSGVLSYVAPALDLYYDVERKHLVRYVGPSNFARETGEKKIRVEFFR